MTSEDKKLIEDLNDYCSHGRGIGVGCPPCAAQRRIRKLSERAEKAETKLSEVIDPHVVDENGTPITRETPDLPDYINRLKADRDSAAACWAVRAERAEAKLADERAAAVKTSRLLARIHAVMMKVDRYLSHFVGPFTMTGWEGPRDNGDAIIEAIERMRHDHAAQLRLIRARVVDGCNRWDTAEMITAAMIEEMGSDSDSADRHGLASGPCADPTPAPECVDREAAKTSGQGSLSGPGAGDFYPSIVDSAYGPYAAIRILEKWITDAERRLR